VELKKLNLPAEGWGGEGVEVVEGVEEVEVFLVWLFKSKAKFVLSSNIFEKQFQFSC